MDPEITRQRIRAARVLSGIKSAEELADRIGEKGLGRDTLYDIERGRRAVRAHELREIARVCDLPYEWFTVEDLGAAVLYGAERIADPLGIPDEAAERLKQIQADQAQLVAALEGTLALEDRVSALADLVTGLSRRLDQIAPKRVPSSEPQTDAR